MISPRDATARAMQAAGADDFGPPGFEEGLERTLAALAALPLTETAQAAAEQKVVTDLATRLRIEQWRKDHPAVAEQKIEGPVLVCGLPRTGTTATVGLMALDERFRFLRAWEAAQPIPPPKLGAEAKDPRRLAALDATKAGVMHISDADGPQEDLVMLAGLNMHAYHGVYPMPDDFLSWWAGADFASTYAYHRRVLQHLQSERPPHLWLLKSPPHLFKLEAFAAEYPDARFVMTHRDPAKVIPSVSSVHYALNAERCRPGALDKTTYGPRWTAFWSDGVERALEARRRIGEDRFIDVWNDDVVRDPVGTFRDLYARLGIAFSEPLQAAVADYNRRNAPGARGEHRYTPEEYGVTRDEIRAAFAHYIDRFGL
jgi:hypothetical protein